MDGATMDNRAGEMQVFLRVVESGSFSEAARLLGMTPSTVSTCRIQAWLRVASGRRIARSSLRPPIWNAMARP
ncbi:hypothetical protein HMPREF0185_03193 [Brevundimonas diminuta 470-4]|nr:hypothetical protein HMPREF0185_03193 [Brevundimonas diminuta 470-4]